MNLLFFARQKDKFKNKMQNFFSQNFFCKMLFSLIYAINQHNFIKIFQPKQDKFLSILRAKICYIISLNLNLENLKNKMIFSLKGYFRTLAVIASSQISVLSLFKPNFCRVFERFYVACGVKTHLAFVLFACKFKFALKLRNYGIA